MDGENHLIAGAQTCSGRLVPGEEKRCVLVSQDTKLFDAQRLRADVRTTDGIQSLVW